MVGNSVANPYSPHPAPDLLVRGTLRIWILLKGKNSKQNLDSYCSLTSFLLYVFKNSANLPAKRNKQRNLLVFCWHLGRSMTKIAGSGSTSKRHGSPYPNPPQNVMDPQHHGWQICACSCTCPTVMTMPKSFCAPLNRARSFGVSPTSEKVNYFKLMLLWTV